jgi:hypothetical protein
MHREPEIIKAVQIADIIHEGFTDKGTINCYIGSNAATPTASIEALSDAIGDPSSSCRRVTQSPRVSVAGTLHRC